MLIVVVSLLYILAFILMTSWKRLNGIRELLVYVCLSNATFLVIEIIYKAEWFIKITTRM